MTAHCAFTPLQSDIKKTTKKKRKREVYGGLLLFCFAKLYIGHLSFWPISKHNGFKKFLKSNQMKTVFCLFVCMFDLKSGEINREVPLNFDDIFANFTMFFLFKNHFRTSFFCSNF